MKKEQVKEQPQKIKVVLTRDIVDSAIVNGKPVRILRKAGETIEIEPGYLEPHFYMNEEIILKLQSKEEELAKKKEEIELEFNRIRAEAQRERLKLMQASQRVSEKSVELANDENERRKALIERLYSPQKE